MLPFLFPLALACQGPAAPQADAPLWIKVDPAEANLELGRALAFRVNLNYPKGVNYLRPPVKWSVQEKEGGAVDAMGHYTAPSTPGIFHVLVERTDAPGVRAVATVTVQ